MSQYFLFFVNPLERCIWYCGTPNIFKRGFMSGRIRRKVLVKSRKLSLVRYSQMGRCFKDVEFLVWYVLERKGCSDVVEISFFKTICFFVLLRLQKFFGLVFRIFN